MKGSKPQNLQEHIRSQEQIRHFPYLTFYLAAFYNIYNGKLHFCKYGVTSEESAILRFINPKYPDRALQYKDWRIEIICEVKMPPDDALECEWNAQLRYPKDIYIKKKIKGVREIFKFPLDVPDFFDKNIKRFNELKDIWHQFNS